MKEELEAYRTGRNWIKVGDTVKCKPVSGNRFKATVIRITEDSGTGQLEIDVVRQGDHRQLRTFTPSSITRVAQSRVETQS